MRMLTVAGGVLRVLTLAPRGAPASYVVVQICNGCIIIASLVILFGTIAPTVFVAWMLLAAMVGIGADPRSSAALVVVAAVTAWLLLAAQVL